jgi:hypothetical protein
MDAGPAAGDEARRPEVCYRCAVRTGLLAVVAALLLAAPALAVSSTPSGWHPTAAWLAQARCVHLKEGPWAANTGNGYFGGMQFAPQTWQRVGGKLDPAFTHSGSAAFPFSATPQEQLYRAWLLWRHDGRSWRSWGGVGAACSR